MNDAVWTLRTQEGTFGPTTQEQLVSWAKLGRIQPGQEISSDGATWQRVEEVPFLDMRFSIDMGDGTPRGPFNRTAAEALLASGRLPPSATIVETRAPFEVETKGEVEKVVAVEAVEKVVEQVVVDDSRVRELEGLLAAAEAKVKEAAVREEKLSEQIRVLEDELRHLPQAASEVADIQAAMFSVMTQEAEEIQKLIEQEKHEADDFKKLHQDRIDRLLERRRNLLKRTGPNVEEMTRKALIERPEDPRTSQMRRALEEMQRTTERGNRLYESKVQELEEALRIKDAELKRSLAQRQDESQLRQEAQSLREKLQLRERELLQARQENENIRKNQAFSQQVLMARLANLESPTIAPASEPSSNQSREAHMVKLPRWMRLNK